MTNAILDYAGRAGPSANPLFDVAGLAVRPFAALASFYRRRAVLARLAELDDRMLCDIGLQRFDITDAASLSPREDVTLFLRGRANERRRAAVSRVHARG